jgi:hypothetical protein
MLFSPVSLSSSLLKLNVLKHSQSVTIALFCDMKPRIHYRLRNEMSRVCAGEFSVLQVNFNLQRHTGYFLIQVYVPCILIVVLSWVSFWIHREATSDRVGLGNCTDCMVVVKRSCPCSRIVWGENTGRLAKLCVDKSKKTLKIRIMGKDTICRVFLLKILNLQYIIRVCMDEWIIIFWSVGC